MVRRRKIRIYDEEMYSDFGQQPDPIEIQIGKELFSLVDEEKESNLLREIAYFRNKIDAEYGIPLPKVRIRDNMALKPFEYSILINGVEVGKDCVRLGYLLCIDTGKVTKTLEYSPENKTKDPAFGMDAFYIVEGDGSKYSNAGYVCVPPEQVIETHLEEIIRKNSHRILNQNLVNTLVEKVRKSNPDVISDVFFYNKFSMSDMKILLNHLLEERVSIRDMNTILETLADNLQERTPIYKLVDKVREHLSYSFIRNYVDENKVLHVFRVSLEISQLLANIAYIPTEKEELPYAAFEPSDRRKFNNSVCNSLRWFNERNMMPVLLCVSDVRSLVASALHHEQPGIVVVSDKELYALGRDITINIEGEITLDD